jgi:hypothetical protein
VPDSDTSPLLYLSELALPPGREVAAAMIVS